MSYLFLSEYLRRATLKSDAHPYVFPKYKSSSHPSVFATSSLCFKTSSSSSSEDNGSGIVSSFQISSPLSSSLLSTTCSRAISPNCSPNLQYLLLQHQYHSALHSQNQNQPRLELPHSH